MAQVEALTEGAGRQDLRRPRDDVKDFGAFIEILPGRDGLCHISELADEYVDSVDDVCKVGDWMQVKVIAIDDQDRVKLSRKAGAARDGRSRRSGRRQMANSRSDAQ